MKMQFKYNSIVQSKAIQAALFAAGYQWMEGQTEYYDAGSSGYIYTDSFRSKCMTRSDSSNDFGLYIVVNGKIVKDGSFVPMQFKAATEAQSREIQDALYAQGYVWASGSSEYLHLGEGTFYICTGMFSEKGKMTYGWSVTDALDFYVVVDGTIYKEGEEPAKLFKKGDKVKCIRETLFSNNLVNGKVYTVFEDQTALHKHRLSVEGVDEWYDVDRFEAYVEPEAEPKIYGNMKFRITDADHSRRVQKALFAAGFFWHGSRLVQYTDASYLFAEVDYDGDKVLSWAEFDAEEPLYFEEQKDYVEMVLKDGDFVPAEFVITADLGELEFADMGEFMAAMDALDQPLQPMGLTPRHEFERSRLLEVLAAISRYVEAGKEVPEDWMSEAVEINDFLNAFTPRSH